MAPKKTDGGADDATQAVEGSHLAIATVFPFQILTSVLWGGLLGYVGAEAHIEAALPPKASAVALIGFGLVMLKVLRIFNYTYVVRAREIYNVPYPTLYATKSENKNAHAFNRAQRADQNLAEHLPFILTLAAFVGFVAEEPCTAGAALVVYSLLRMAYTHGYSKGASKRLPWFILSVMVENALMGRVGFFVYANLILPTLNARAAA